MIGSRIWEWVSSFGSNICEVHVEIYVRMNVIYVGYVKHTCRLNLKVGM